jgi:hypothetical protein
MPANVRDFFDLAAKLHVIDSADMWALTIDHRKNFDKMMDTVIEWAFCNIHVNSEPHNVLSRMRDRIMAEARK